MTSYLYAGEWGPEAAVDNTGRPQSGAQVTLYLADGLTQAVRYTDRTKATATSNPWAADSRGNVVLFADPGSYVLEILVKGVATRFNITVPIDPAEAVLAGRDPKESCRVATTANLGALSGLLTIDGVVLVAGDRVLVKDQIDGTANGIYVASAVAWGRAIDADTSAKLTAGSYTFVTEGTVNGGTGFTLITADPITLGTTALVWSATGGVEAIIAGTALVKSGHTIGVAPGGITDTEVAAANKDGLTTTASLRTLGTGAQQAAAGNDSRLSDKRVPTDGSVGDTQVSAISESKVTNLTTDLAAKQGHDTDLDTIAALDSATAGALVTDGAGWIRKTYAQLKTALGLVKGDVGLGNVDNTSDVNKPVSTAQAAADASAVATAEAFSVQRANHTGTQLASTVSDFDTQVRTSRLDQMAAPGAAVPFNAKKITGLADPSAAQDGMTKAFADAAYASVAAVRRPNTVVLLGTSMTSANRQVSGVANAFDGILYNSCRGPFTWANAALGHRLDVVNFAGVVGETSTQVVARLAADLTAYAPGYCIVDLFTNDIKGVGSAGAVAAAVATMQANALSVLNACDAKGTVALLVGPPPITGATNAQLEALYQIVRWCKYLSMRRGNLIFIDTHALLVDGATAEDWKNPSVVQWTTDGTHWGPWGSALVGSAIADALDPLVPVVDIAATGGAGSLLSSVADANLLVNSALAGSGGSTNHGATGTVPASWTLTSSDSGALAGAVVGSTVARTNEGAGNWWQVQATGAASKPRLYQEVTLASAKWAPGDVLAAQCELDIPFADLSSLTTLRLVCAVYRTSDFKAVSAYDLSWTESATDWVPAEVFAGRKLVLRTPPIVAPDVGGAGAAFFALDFIGLGTVRLGRASLVKNPTWGTV